MQWRLPWLGAFLNNRALMQPKNPTSDSQPGNAGLIRRLAAMLYDSLLLAGVLFAFTLLLVLLRAGEAIEPGAAWFRLALLALIVAFHGGFWVYGGQTLGMKAWRLRLVGSDGHRIGWPRAWLRLGAACLSILPFGLGYVWCLFDRKGLSWHDRLSGTRIVHINAREPGRSSSPSPAPDPAPKQ